MLQRYSRKELADIWTDEHKYKTWLEVELLACEAWARLGKIPKKSLVNIRKKSSRLNIGRISKVEENSKADAFAFFISSSGASGSK